ncbi:MAG: DUF1800 domain-containing protein [Paracoccaceae bacterium]
MSVFNPELAEVRFGYGLSPNIKPPENMADLLAGLQAADDMAVRFPIETFDTFRERMVALQLQFKIEGQNRGTDKAKAARKQRKVVNREARVAATRWMVQSLMRATHSEHAFRERLCAFWGDHFTARGKARVIRQGTGPYLEDAIRPNLTGRFSDMLLDAVMHPLMLHYLDQERSMGPESTRALRRRKPAGLNENLAREVLELHTLGVDGPYTQNDVRQLAELFTGMTVQANVGFKFRKDWAEPGPETVLDKSYGPRPGIEPIRAALQDLAAHPATARHVAWKLAVHFVSDDPDTALIDHVAQRFIETDGDLLQVYAALLEHPSAWVPTLRNAKPPDAFIASSFRALAIDESSFDDLREKDLRAGLLVPLTMMGQPWQAPSSPAGWDEEDDAWLTPQGLAWRVQWSMAFPSRLMKRLPDPRKFVESALGPFATEEVRFAAKSAESRNEAIGLVLMAPAFQRR